MPIFNSGCNSITNSDKTIKFEGNNLIILAGGVTMFNSNQLRFWYDTVADWLTTRIEIAPGDTRTFEYDFDFIYINIERPTTTVTTLSHTVKLFDGIVEKLSMPLRDMFIINSDENYTSVQISNTSTGLTAPILVTLLLTKTIL